MFKVKYLLYFILSVFFTLSCSNNNLSSHSLLTHAQEIIENDPKFALILLDSVISPKDMGQDAYMQYVVTYVEAKRRSNLDVTADTLIFEAQTYFNNKGESTYSVLANYYAGKVCSQSKIWDRAISSYQEAIKHASIIKDRLLLGKSYHSLGYIYYENSLLDSALINFQQAFEIYSEIPNVNLFKMQVLTRIGFVYDIKQNYDDAEKYFKQSFDLAVQTEDKLYQGYGKQNLGMVCLGRKDYDEALNCFKQALPSMGNAADSIRVYLNLSKLYTETQKLDSAAYYASIIKKSLPEIKDNWTFAYTCDVLKSFYQKEKNFEEALRYSVLCDSVRQIINNSNLIAQLNKAELKRELALENEKASSKRDLHFVWMIVGNIIFLLLVTSSFIYFKMRSKINKQELEHVKHELEKIKLKEKMETERSEFFQFSATAHYKQ